MPTSAIAANPVSAVAVGPRCAQCQTVMMLERVEPHPAEGGKERHTYVCIHCRLADRVDCSCDHAMAVSALR